MSIASAIGAVVLVLALVSGLLLALGTVKAKKTGDQAMFVAGWWLILVASLMIVQIY